MINLEEMIINSSQIAISPQKMNLIASLIRKKKLEDSLTLLRFLPKKGARILYKLIKEFVSRLNEKNETIDYFFLKTIRVNKGRTRKKISYRAKGRADMIKNRHCWINLVLSKK